MKNWRIVIKGLLLCIVLLAVTSCEPTPLVTIEWEPDESGLFIQFQTNDPANASQKFVKLYPATDFNPMTEVEVTVKKNFGLDINGFGIVFCASDDQQYYYKVAITVNRRYTITKVVAGYETTVAAWAYTNRLDFGYGKINTIKVTRTVPAVGDPYFTLFFNTQLERDRIEEGSALFTRGQSGFYAYVGSVLEEYLPAAQVDVRFQMTSPVYIP